MCVCIYTLIVIECFGDFSYKKVEISFVVWLPWLQIFVLLFQFDYYYYFSINKATVLSQDTDTL